MKTLLSAVVVATLALNAVQAGADGKPGERQIALQVESTTLAEALDQWAIRSGYQIFVQDWDLAKQLIAPDLKGTFSAEAALQKLLVGSPLMHVWIDAKTVSIRRIQRIPASSLQNDDVAFVPEHGIAKLRSNDFSPHDSSVNAGAMTHGDQYGQSRRGTTGLDGLVGDVEEVIVTGTHIKGSTPQGHPSCNPAPVRSHNRVTQQWIGFWTAFRRISAAVALLKTFPP